MNEKGIPFSDNLLTLTKRELFAAIALSGVKTSTIEHSAILAIELADALILALEATSPPKSS